MDWRKIFKAAKHAKIAYIMVHFVNLHRFRFPSVLHACMHE